MTCCALPMVPALSKMQALPSSNAERRTLVRQIISRRARWPLLTEVLDLFDKKMLIDIEIKNAPIGYEGIEEDLLYAIEPYRERLKFCCEQFRSSLFATLACTGFESKWCIAAASMVEIADIVLNFREVI